MNYFLKFRNTDRLVKNIAQPENFKNQSSLYWNKKRKKLLFKNIECITLPYKNFRKFK